MAKVFVSYVREDLKIVRRVASRLRSVGLEVWLDKDSIPSGARWQDHIQSAIETGDFFVACFSKAYNAKLETYMNEELLQAIARLRCMPRSRSWFLPLLLDRSEVPALAIGPGETIHDLQCTKLREGFEEAISKLLAVMVSNDSAGTSLRLQQLTATLILAGEKVDRVHALDELSTS